MPVAAAQQTASLWEEPRALVCDGSVTSRGGHRGTGSVVVLAQTSQLGPCNPLGVFFPLSLHLVHSGQGQTLLQECQPPHTSPDSTVLSSLERHFGICIPPPCPALGCASLKQD